MNFPLLILKNIFNIPLICFLCGILTILIKPRFRISSKISKVLTLYILFCVGLKGGGPLAEYSTASMGFFFLMLGALVFWGLLSPLLSFYLLNRFTVVDRLTAAAIAGCFGSVSVMTFITATSFLDQMNIGYQKLIIAALAIMEIPAIISAIFIAKKFDKTASLPINKLIFDSIFNKVILGIVAGLIIGATFYYNNINQFSEFLLWPFKPMLCLFLFDMGLNVGLQKEHFRFFSRSLNLFGIYMPLIGGGFGLLLSYFLGLDVGSGTLVAVLTASASYIAVPAAMQIALPGAKEGIYLPLSLGIVFPFNVIIGIPLYYYLSLCFLT